MSIKLFIYLEVRIMKKRLFLLPVSALLALMSCRPAQAVDHAVIDPSKDTFNIGILQIASFPALDSAEKAFEKVLFESPLLANKNINIDYEISNGDSSIQTTQAKSLVTSSDLLFGVATPSAVALKNARDEAGKKQPLLFTAVTDPVTASLMKSLTGHDGSVTGTSDDNPVESQIGLIKRIFGESAIGTKKLGIIYTSSEINSEVQADRAKAEAIKQGMPSGNITIATCTGSSDLSQVATNLINKVDVIYIPTDNNIADNMPVIKAALHGSNTLCIVGEEGMLQSGGHITFSVNYSVLGRKAGEMAANILSGTQLTENIDCFKSLDESEWNKVFSSANIADAGITIPSSALEGFEDIND